MTMRLRPAMVLLLLATACASRHGGETPVAGLTPEARACPDWSRGSAEDFSNRATSNFGCADTVNFHAQLARPQDAVKGRGSDTSAADGAVTAIERMRTRPAAPAAAAGASETPMAKPEPGA